MTWRPPAVVPLALAALVACTTLACRQERSPASASQPRRVTWGSAARLRPDALHQVLHTSHRDAWRQLGPHRFTATQRLRVTVAGQPTEELSDDYLIEAGSGDDFRARHHNSRGLGFEAQYVGGQLYVKERYGAFARRSPEGLEHERTREQVYGALAAVGELLGRYLTARNAGPTKVGDRSALRLTLALASEPTGPPPAGGGARAWRRTIALTSASGSLVVDAASGVPLSADLKVAFSYRQGGHGGSVALEYQGRLEPLAALSFTPPPHLPQPTRRRYELERAELLHGLIGRRRR